MTLKTFEDIVEYLDSEDKEGWDRLDFAVKIKMKAGLLVYIGNQIEGFYKTGMVMDIPPDLIEELEYLLTDINIDLMCLLKKLEKETVDKDKSKDINEEIKDIGMV